jgi:hypothetical protein
LVWCTVAGQKILELAWVGVVRHQPDPYTTAINCFGNGAVGPRLCRQLETRIGEPVAHRSPPALGVQIRIQYDALDDQPMWRLGPDLRARHPRTST